MKRKNLIICIVTVIMAIAGAIFGIAYTDEDIKEISEGIDTIVEIVENQSSTEIPEAYIEDEQKLEEQEIESEAFQLQGEIAYNGSSEIPKIDVGEYAGLTYYSQIDSRWKNKLYTSTGNTTQTMGSSACGPTCGAMVVSSIKGTILPTEMADLYVKYGFRSANNGTYWSAFRWTADVFDIDYKEIYKLNEVCDLLEQNYMIISACGNGLFTTGGHFILIYGYQDNNGDNQCDVGDYLKVYDPYLYSGKFNTSTRRGKTIVDGNTVLVEKETFREYANYSIFFAFKNDRKDIKDNVKVETTTATYTRYVKVNSSLNVRKGAGTNYSYIRSLYNGDAVSVYEEKGNWSRIGTNEWVCSDYLTDGKKIVQNTVGEYRKLKNTTTLYSKSNLSGTRYTYLKNTTVQILENITESIDRIYVPATGRYAYVDKSAYTMTAGINMTGQYKRFKDNTIIYSKSNLAGNKYYYLPNTYIKILEDLGDVNKIYVTATGRIGYVKENVYK